MNAPPTETRDVAKARKPLWRRILKWTIRAAIVLVVAAGVAWGVLNYVSAKELEAQISKIKAAGRPVSLAEWERSLPPVAEADNAAPYYKAALALRRGSTDEKVNRLLDWLKDPSSQSTTAPADPSAETQHVLAENALALEMVDRGQERPQCAFDLGVSYGIAGVLPQLQESRSVAKLLCLRTLHLARQKEPRQAAESLLSSLRMLRMFERQPILVSYLVKTACTAMYVQAVPAVLEAGPLTDQDLAELESALGRADISDQMQQFWMAEQVYVLELFRNLIAVSPELVPGGAARMPEAYPHGVMASPVFRLMVTRQLRMYERYMEATGKGFPQALDAVHAIPKSGYGVFGGFCQIVAPSFDAAFVILARVVGQVRSAQVAVMVERYRLARGKLPTSLAELRDFTGHDLPADPFTGKELVYKVQGQGFMVYSVGDDKTDDGGPAVARQSKDWGVAVRMPRAGQGGPGVP